MGHPHSLYLLLRRRRHEPLSEQMGIGVGGPPAECASERVVPGGRLLTLMGPGMALLGLLAGWFLALAEDAHVLFQVVQHLFLLFRRQF